MLSLPRGGASTLAFVEKESLRLIRGKESIVTFKATLLYKYDRNFCRQCGTGLSEILRDQNMFPIAVNCVDTDPELRSGFTNSYLKNPDGSKFVMMRHNMRNIRFRRDKLKNIDGTTDLFEQKDKMSRNLLPRDGTVYYDGPIMSQQEADNYHETLLSTIAWKHDRTMIVGKEMVPKRKVAWYAEHLFVCTYSKITKIVLT